MKYAPAIAFAATCIFATTTPANGSDHHSHAQKIVDQHVAGWNSHDASAIASQFAEDADHVASNGTRTVGRDKIEANYKRFLGSERYGKSAHETKDVHTREVGDGVLLVDVETTVSGIVDDAGKAMPDRDGVYTLLLVKKDSDWQIAALRSMVPRSTTAK